jgi:hypothetical protein
MLVFAPFPSYARPFATSMIALFFRGSEDQFPFMSDSNQRIGELAEILAVALQRLLARQSSRNLAPIGESSLHISPDQSVPAETAGEGDVA